jgi:hypothetical protein
MALANGARLGPYEIVDLLGRGGMGEVYRALDSRLGRQVAIKVLPAHLIAHSESLTRFRREARAVAALSHPNILAVFDIGTEAGAPYVVTELLDGETLRARLERGPLPLDEMLPISMAIAEGLAAAHAKGIIHRDLKPDNVFLTATGGVKILDFGLAATLRPIVSETTDTETMSRALTEPGMVIGTIGYMSPEQLRGQPLTTATDVFAFGCVAYEMLRGHMPFRRDSNIETIASVLRDEPFERGGPGYMPPEVRTIIEHCLDKNAAKRIQSGSDLVDELREIAAKHAKGRLSTATTMRVRLLPRVNRVLLFIAALLVVAAGVAGVTTFMAGRQKVIDNGYDLRVSDITGSDETRRLTAVALRSDAAGDRSGAIELFREAARSDTNSPLPAAFLASFIYYNGDRVEGERWSKEALRRVAYASSAYERLLTRYLLPINDGATLMALASSLLELRPAAWRLRLSLAHRHLDRREMPAMLAQLKMIDVSAPDDRRLVIVLADRASLGDIDGALRDLRRSRLIERPALLAFTEGRIAWSRGRAADAARLFKSAAEAATATNLTSVSIDSYVLEGVAEIGTGDMTNALATLDIAAVKANQASLHDYELQAYAYGAYAAYRLADMDGVNRRLEKAILRAEPGTSDYYELVLFKLRTGAGMPILPGQAKDEESDMHAGLQSLIAAREAWSHGYKELATAMLQRSRAEGVDATWFAEEAALLDYDLGAPARSFRADPPYPNRLRFIAAWELQRPRVAK